MIGEPVLLDTNIVVEHFRPPGKHKQALAAHVLYLPEIVVAELLAGALRSQRPDHHRATVEEFLDSVTLIACNFETAEIYAKVWAKLADSGKMIPHNDIWIASLAIQLDLRLISNDSHFQRIDGLKWESW